MWDSFVIRTVVGSSRFKSIFRYHKNHLKFFDIKSCFLILSNGHLYFVLNLLVALWPLQSSVVFFLRMTVVFHDEISLLACSCVGNFSFFELLWMYSVMIVVLVLILVCLIWTFDVFMWLTTLLRIRLDSLPVVNHDPETGLLCFNLIRVEDGFGCSFCHGGGSVRTVHLCFVELLFLPFVHNIVLELLISVVLCPRPSPAYWKSQFFCRNIPSFPFVYWSWPRNSSVFLYPFWILMSMTFLLSHLRW